MAGWRFTFTSCDKDGNNKNTFGVWEEVYLKGELWRVHDTPPYFTPAPDVTFILDIDGKVVGKATTGRNGKFLFKVGRLRRDKYRASATSDVISSHCDFTVKWIVFPMIRSLLRELLLLPF